jgi:alpha-beta hydrolase superfamily lysophospholipase
VPDAQVRSAIEHWAPRLIQNGVDHNDFVATVGSIETWAEWLPAWSRLADEAAAAAAHAEASGRARTAGEQFLRAAVARHFGKFVWLLDEGLHARETRRSVDELLAAHRLLGTGAERIETRSAVANLRRPRSAPRPPLVVLVPGLDSTKEEFFHLEESFLRRGMATLSIDGPGQGEVGLTQPIRHDYEACVSPMLDLLASRADLDHARIGIFGVSLGGYYAARTAAHEPRIRALVALSGPYDWGEIWPQLPPLTKQAFTAKSRATGGADAHERAAALNLRGVCERIAAPALFVTGRHDRIVPPEQTQRAARESPNGAFVLHDAGNHGCSNLTPTVRPALADWMRERLAGD